MSTSKAAKKTTKKNAQSFGADRKNGAPASAQLTASVKVMTAEVDQDLLNKCTDKIQRAVENAIEAGVREGVGKVLAKLGITTELVGKLSSTRQTAARAARGGAKKQNASQYASDKLEENGLTPTTSGSSKTLHKASPRQRGTLEADARKVFDDLKANPMSQNENIVARTRLDARTVGQALRYLRGFNVRGEKVREPVLFLPDGDRKRYTTYSVVAGATFPPFPTPAPKAKAASAKRVRAKRKTAKNQPAAPAAAPAAPERVVEPEEQANG